VGTGSNIGARRAPKRPFVAALLAAVATLVAWWVGAPPAPASDAQDAATVAGQDGLDGLRGLAERWLGERAASVSFELSSGPIGEGHDAFAVIDVEGATRIFGESRVALARGLYEYLRRDCAVSPGWWSGRASPAGADAPAPLPRATPARGGSPHALRLHLSPEACAHGAAFWDAARWEREIDVAALRGLNACLLPIGTDRVMMAVHDRLGLDPAVSRTWFPAAAFRAFGWSGLAGNWLGPLSLAFAEADARIARRVFARMQELGVEPVLPVFTGVLPAGFASAFPQATFHPLPGWVGLPGMVLLDPADPLFARVAELFYEEQATRIGMARHHFGTPTSEVRLPFGEPARLAELARAVGGALAAARPGARWLASAWALRFDRGYWTDERVAAWIGATDPAQVVFVDRMAAVDPLWERTGGFHGRDFLWGTTPALGARQRLGARLELAGSELARAAAAHPRTAGPGLLGAALAIEAPGVDPLRFDHLCDQLWSREPLVLDTWIEGWVTARYGTNDARAVRAWRAIARAAYGDDASEGGPSVVASAPGTLPPPRQERAAEIAAAWGELVQVAEAQTPRPDLLFDVVDVGRQVLSDACTHPIASALEAWHAGDAAALGSASERMLALVDDLDALLATHPGFLLGAWLEAAAARGADDAERAALVRGARALVTHFGPPGSAMRDGSGREWAGLVGSFHRERWRRFFSALGSSLTSGGTFDAQAFDAELAAFESRWAEATSPFPSSPMGDTLEVARRLVDTWLPEYGPAPTVDASVAGALVDERSVPLARWRLGGAAALDGTRLASELEFLVWMRTRFGQGFDLVEWRALGWDTGTSVGTRDALVATFDGGPTAVREAASRAAVRLALVGSADGFGDDAAAERSRRRQLELVVKDLDLGAIVLDGALGALRPAAVDALGATVALCRERAPGLLVLARGLDLGPLANLSASRGSARGPWLAAPAVALPTPHAHDLALGRADSRLFELEPLVLDGRAGWDDALVWRAFGLAPLFAIDVVGAPWLLDDDDLVRFARLLERFGDVRALLADAPVQVATAAPTTVVVRGTPRYLVAVVRNLSFEAQRVELTLGADLGIDPSATFEVRQWHPTERHLGSATAGAKVALHVEPGRCALVVLSADGFDEPMLDGVDQHWEPAPGGARRVRIVGVPGSEVRTRLVGPHAFGAATVDGVGVDALLGGGDVRLRFDGRAPVGPYPRALGALEVADLPTNADELARVARAALGAPTLLARLDELPTSGFEAVARARRLARVDVEQFETSTPRPHVLTGVPARVRRLRAALPENLPPGAELLVAVEWDGEPGAAAVVARVPERGLVGAARAYGTPSNATYALALDRGDAGREVDVWLLVGDAGGSVLRARAFVAVGDTTVAQRTLEFE
jgi:alpha-N-acetylglucosaminidase